MVRRTAASTRNVRSCWGKELTRFRESVLVAKMQLTMAAATARCRCGVVAENHRAPAMQKAKRSQLPAKMILESAMVVGGSKSAATMATQITPSKAESTRVGMSGFREESAATEPRIPKGTRAHTQPSGVGGTQLATRRLRTTPPPRTRAAGKSSDRAVKGVWVAFAGRSGSWLAIDLADEARRGGAMASKRRAVQGASCRGSAVTRK